jgi:hypothetical protein
MYGLSMSKDCKHARRHLSRPRLVPVHQQVRGNNDAKLPSKTCLPRLSLNLAFSLVISLAQYFVNHNMMEK